MSTKLIEKIDHILEECNLPERYTKFQLEKFVIGKEPTGHAQLWQCVRELAARRETIESFQKDLEDAEDNLELFDIKIERLNRLIREEAKNESGFTDLNIQEHEINIRKLQREKESLVIGARKLRHKLEQQLEEMVFLVETYERIVSIIGKMAPLDSEEAQQEMWNEKYLEEFNLRLLLQRPLDPDLIRSIMCLHEDAPVRQHMTKLLENQKRRLIQNKET